MVRLHLEVSRKRLLAGCSRVKKRQVIAAIKNLDFIDLQQKYLEAKSNFDFAKADYERQQGLARENVNSEKNLQQAKDNLFQRARKISRLAGRLII